MVFAVKFFNIGKRRYEHVHAVSVVIRAGPTYSYATFEAYRTTVGAVDDGPTNEPVAHLIGVAVETLQHLPASLSCPRRMIHCKCMYSPQSCIEIIHTLKVQGAAIPLSYNSEAASNVVPYRITDGYRNLGWLKLSSCISAFSWRRRICAENTRRILTWYCCIEVLFSYL
jgi:hypothetical protein